jgi:hypothetical protein
MACFGEDRLFRRACCITCVRTLVESSASTLPEALCTFIYCTLTIVCGIGFSGSRSISFISDISEPQIEHLSDAPKLVSSGAACIFGRCMICLMADSVCSIGNFAYIVRGSFQISCDSAVLLMTEIVVKVVEIQNMPNGFLQYKETAPSKGLNRHFVWYVEPRYIAVLIVLIFKMSAPCT